MSKAFDIAISALFSDQNLTIMATHLSTKRKVPVILHKPDDFTTVSESIIATPTMTADVMLALCPRIQAGDQFVIADKRYVVRGEPKKDTENVTAKISLHEV